MRSTLVIFALALYTITLFFTPLVHSEAAPMLGSQSSPNESRIRKCLDSCRTKANNEYSVCSSTSRGSQQCESRLNSQLQKCGAMCQ
ncbi:hypothetical protein BC939DRAFT_456177 [Gamsiella multidivaricata]|uniref:uncharacterized protein n=1 Tax=Gamsiella multidivaricata TaxID=101098 RepID=UPI00221F9577|nr:uncharacterized protein BC939DRAFT_456177 [Gamsiella multidivaricata]KAI7821221.1 hypothetical protein BC939DRAFT_456177 [Gamsiella multidivaricata]